MASTRRKAIDPRHRILRVPPIYHEATTKIHGVIGHQMGYQVNVHANCVCNELISLHNRHLVDRSMIPFDKALWKRVTNRTLKYYPQKLTPLPYEEIVNSYSGAKKRTYWKAMWNVRTYGIERKHFVVKMFVKPDRYPTGDIGGKDPRAIQYRSPEFNLAYGAYIKPYEEEIYPTVHYGVISKTRVIAKGLNNYQRAQLLLHKIDHFRRPVYVLIDHSRFDSTINVSHLRSTHKKYQRAFRSRTLGNLMRAQYKNVGYSKGGIKYRTLGTRMSGDPDTACGNTVVNGDALYGFLTESGIEKYDFVLDGDDSVVIVEQDDVERLDFGLFARLGFQTKWEVVKDLDEVEFCQSKLVLAQEPVLVRKPERVLSHTSYTRKKYPRRTIGRWIAAVGECERACNLGVPVLQTYGEKLASLTSNYFIDDEMRYRWELGQHVKSRPITADARATFALAFGVTWDIQVMMEGLDYTAVSYCSVEKITSDNYRHEQCRLSRITRRIETAAESTPEHSGSCWWSSSATRGQRPGRGCI